MARQKRPAKRASSDKSSTGVIDAFTRSAERIGVDGAYYATVTIVALGALPFSEGDAVTGIEIVYTLSIVGWVLNRVAKACTEYLKVRSRIQLLRAQYLPALVEYVEAKHSVESATRQLTELSGE